MNNVQRFFGDVLMSQCLVETAQLAGLTEGKDVLSDRTLVTQKALYTSYQHSSTPLASTS
jgi:hypothetical protein